VFLSQPQINFNYSYQNFKVFFDGAYTYRNINLKNPVESGFTVLQSYIKFQGKVLEAKLGRIAFIPGFVGLLNPYLKTPYMETLFATYKGDDGIFLRFIKGNWTSTLFATMDTLKNCQLKFQMDQILGPFELGLYEEMGRQVNLGLFLGYFGSFTGKIQTFREGKDYRYSVQLETKYRDLILSVTHFYTGNPKVFPMFGYVMPSRKLTILEFKFPQRVFEIPYILLAFDHTNKIPILSADLKYILSNSLYLESGLVVSYFRERPNFAIYLGFKITKGLWF